MQDTTFLDYKMPHAAVRLPSVSLCICMSEDEGPMETKAAGQGLPLSHET